MHTSPGSLLTALAAAAIISAVAAGPAAADTAAPGARAIVHETPTVPLVVDGVSYAPEQIHRFDGRPLYMRPARDGKKLIATTKLGRFKAFLRTRGERLPGAADLQTAKAKASLAGHSMSFMERDPYVGDCWGSVDSGYGIANFGVLQAQIGCQFANTIDYVYPYGQNGVLFDWSDFRYSGGIMYVYANTGYELSRYGWANKVESLFQYW
jgi:hypothetical protein